MSELQNGASLSSPGRIMLIIQNCSGKTCERDGFCVFNLYLGV